MAEEISTLDYNETFLVNEEKVALELLKSVFIEKSIREVPLPYYLMNSMSGRVDVDKVFINNIKAKYYTKLNNSEAIIVDTDVYKRKYDYKGNYMLDENNNYIYEEVKCPTDSKIILSDIIIEDLPNEFKMDGIEQVDYIVDSTKTKGKVIYIVPKCYLHKLTQTALIISFAKQRAYYSGFMLATNWGNTIYLQVIKYTKQTRNGQGYVILDCRTTDNYQDLIGNLVEYWISCGFILNPYHQEMKLNTGLAKFKCFKNRYSDNIIYCPLEGGMEVYDRYNEEKTLATISSTEGQDNSMMQV